MAKRGPKGKHVVDKIDQDELKKLAAMQCTNEEIAAWFGCSADTIEENFRALIKEGRAKGRMSMKRALFEKMQKGDLGAMVWWGKNFAGMSDKTEQRIEGTQTHNVNVKEVTDILTEHKDLIAKANKQ